MEYVITVVLLTILVLGLSIALAYYKTEYELEKEIREHYQALYKEHSDKYDYLHRRYVKEMEKNAKLQTRETKNT